MTAVAFSTFNKDILIPTLTEMQSDTKKSTETIFEIKAPLATFDTVDLEDDTLTNTSFQNLKAAVTTGQDIVVTVASASDSISPQETSNITCVKEPCTPTSSTAPPKLDNESPVNVLSESDQLTSTEASVESKETNSSENGASAEEIQNRLKVKGRKHKAKACNVKYEQMDSCTSDVSDQEKSENKSPLPVLKHNLRCDTDSESSDSDSGYIRSGYISATKGKVGRHIKVNLQNNLFSAAGDFTDSRDSTPCSSPKITRPVLPPPLSKEDSAIRSKRRAYEKRLQRLQVTTNPIERPRSTTPINIYGLEEYVNISSPEKSPGSGNLEKLKIKLPVEESIKTRSPRRSTKVDHSSDENQESHVFSFNEELLFTRTKSAILLQEDGHKGQSPKRILVPPTLSPQLSPARSPRIRPAFAQDPKSFLKYFYSPISGSTDNAKDNSFVNKQEVLNDNDIPQNWAKFDDTTFTQSENVTSSESIKSKDSEYENNLESTSGMLGKKGIDNVDALFENLEEKSKCVTENDRCHEFMKDEILTVRIEESGNSRTCDIKYQSLESVDGNSSDQNSDQVGSSSDQYSDQVGSSSDQNSDQVASSSDPTSSSNNNPDEIVESRKVVEELQLEDIQSLC